MNTVRCARFGEDDEGTPSTWSTPGFRCFCLQLPWRDNLPEISRLPDGVYVVQWAWSDHFRRFMYLIQEDIPNRGGFRVHSGNFAGDRAKGLRSHSLGCPLLGYQFGRMQGQRAILVSRPAVEDFERFMQFKPFTLEIV